MVSSEVVDALIVRTICLIGRAATTIVAGGRHRWTTNRTILNSFWLMPIGDFLLRRYEATSPPTGVCQCRLPNQKGRLPAPFLIAVRLLSYRASGKAR